VTQELPAGKGAIVITGASTGIGKECALHLDRLGYRVFAGYRKEADAQSLRDMASERLTPILLDVTGSESIAAAVEAVDAATKFGPLLGLVNNAGVGVGGPLEYIPIDEVRWQFEVNVLGLIAVTQAFLPALRRAPGARIVHIGSIAGKVTTPLMGPYCASKHAVESISDAFRGELAPWGIHSCVVEPGMIETPIWSKANDAIVEAETKFSAEARERYGSSFALMGRRFAKAAKAAAPAQLVADAVEHALTAPRPKTRYLVGKDARAGAFLRWLLPDRGLEWVLSKT
jgi:NAD(P)-dependent dehydrogenase (short-subunit alcohol dehydrogenase family)